MRSDALRQDRVLLDRLWKVAHGFPVRLIPNLRSLLLRVLERYTYLAEEMDRVCAEITQGFDFQGAPHRGVHWLVVQRDTWQRAASERNLETIDQTIEMLKTLQAENDILRERLDFGTNRWNPVGGRACPLCVYEQGKFIRMCKLHEHEQTVCDALIVVKAERDKLAEIVRGAFPDLAESIQEAAQKTREKDNGS